LLKIISWSEREHELKKKDAEDLSYLLETYEKINHVNEKIFESESLMNQYDWNITLASSHLLGLNSASIAGEFTKLRILEILDNNLKINEPTKLVSDMCVMNSYDESFEVLKAFANGFSEK